MNRHQSQGLALILTGLTIPMWWFVTPAVDPKSANPAEAVARIRRDLESGSGTIRMKTWRDLESLPNSYADLLIQAARNTTNHSVVLGALLNRTPPALMRALMNRLPNERADAKIEVMRMLGKSDLDLDEFGPEIAKLLEDPDERVREETVDVFNDCTVRTPPEVIDLATSSKASGRLNAVRSIARKFSIGPSEASILGLYTHSKNRALREAARYGLRFTDYKF